jgi:catechol 2,3-dioxygenase-like lactoylglutathione lyase family enzyme
VIKSFDRILISVPDLHAACDEYAALLGARPIPFSKPGHAWLGLANTVLELVERPVAAATIEALVLQSAESTPSEVAFANDLGLDLRLSDGVATTEFRQSHNEACLIEIGVDHLVLRAVDADRCIALFNGELGIRLALDQDVPEWGGRMLFFRAGKLTLEVIANQTADPPVGNTFWGMTFQVPDIDTMAAQLDAAGVELSAVRNGRKPGTRVATVHSHCLGLPTLLLQPTRP